MPEPSQQTRQAGTHGSRAGDGVTPELYQVARQESWRYYVPGYTREDMEQEALLAIIQALPKHRPERGPVTTYARFAARRNIQDLIRVAKASRQGALNESRFAPENSYLDAPTLDGQVEARERLRNALTVIAGMPALERRAVIGTALGFTYAEIGDGAKQVDNAVQRARRKLAA